MGTKTMALIQTSSNSGHHDCSRKAVFPCTAVKLQPCHMLAHWTQHTGSYFTFQSAFISAIALLVLWNSFLGWPWAHLGCCLRNGRKTLMSTTACFCMGQLSARQTCKNHLRRINKDANSCTWRQAGADNPKLGPWQVTTTAGSIGGLFKRSKNWTFCFGWGGVFFKKKLVPL